MMFNIAYRGEVDEEFTNEAVTISQVWNGGGLDQSVKQ